MIFNEKGHLTKETLQGFQTNHLSAQDLFSAAEHISACDFCAEELAALCEPVLAPPRGFAEQVKQRLQRQKIKEFHAYALSVSTAVCASVLILITGAFSLGKAFQPAPPKLDALNTINQHITDFSDHIYHMEGFSNGKEK